MIVVADSSPLIVLVTIGHIDVLPLLFQMVFIPPAVSIELMSGTRAPAVRAYFSDPPEWLKIRGPQKNQPIPNLHFGETEALNLAVELAADFFLVDERTAYREAVARKVNAIGTIRVLELAADENLIDLAAAFERIKLTNFWVSQSLLDERLRLHLLHKNTK
jgi:predicted nucleic acid-binding protein